MRILSIILFLSFSVTNINAQQLQSDTCSLDSLIHKLPEVMIKGQQPVVKVENGILSYNIPLLLKQMSANDAYEALTHIPGVSDIDGCIKFAGQAVTLIINGKPTTLTQEQLKERLKTMPATTLAKAEVMMAAPARYNVRGMAINIVTKDMMGTEQFSGQMTAAWQQSKYGAGIGRGNIIWQKGKLGLDAQYSYFNGDVYREAAHIAYQPQTSGPVAYNDKTWQRNRGISHDYRIGLDYAFQSNHRLNAAYTGLWYSGNALNHTSGTSISQQHTKEHTYMHNVDVSYSLPFSLQLNASYTNYQNPQTQDLNGSMMEEKRKLSTNSDQTIHKWFFSADQHHGLARNWALSYGAKTQFVNNKSFQATIDADGMQLPATSSSVDMNEKIYNIYASISKQFNKGINFDASVEAEKYHSSQWDEWHVYPSLNAMWKINNDHLLNLSFSSNTEFPSYWSTMNQIFYSSAYSEIWGNPSLKPSSIYSLHLMWQLKQKYCLVLFANFNPDYFVQLPYQPSDRMAVIMKETNFDYSNTFGIQTQAMFNVGTWLNGNVMLCGMYRHDKSSNFFDLPFDRSKFTIIASGTVSARLLNSRKMYLDIKPFFQSNAIQGLYDIKPLLRLDATLRWSSKNDKWTIKANGTNLLNTKFDTRSIYRNQDYRLKVAQNWVTVTIGVVYRFGNYKEKEVNKVDTSRMGH